MLWCCSSEGRVLTLVSVERLRMKPRTTPEGSNVHGKKVRHSCRRLLRGALCKESRERLSSILCHFSAMAQWPLSSRLPFNSNHNCASPVTSPELKVFPNSPFVFPSPQSTFLPDPLHIFLLLLNHPSQ